MYRDRILRSTGHDGFYSCKKLGAFGADLGAVACFFDEPWRRLAPALSEGEQAWLLSLAAYHLRALGRLEEALEPMRAGAEMLVKQANWENASKGYRNLSELQLSLGRVAAAEADAEASVAHADHSGDAFECMVNRTTLADALHQQGGGEAAAARFAEAEALQQERQPEYPLLYSLQGFLYCDLLLAGAERAAWGAMLALGAETSEENGGNGIDQVGRGLLRPNPTSGGSEDDAMSGSPFGDAGAALPRPNPDASNPNAAPALLDLVPQPNLGDNLRDCMAVAERAARTLKWLEDNNLALLDSALDHLTLSRCALYTALLQGQPPDDAQAEIDQAVSGLRAAGQQQYISLGLLTRAWLRHCLGDEAGARADLIEVERIASRGNMRLHLADLHLTRARLFRDERELSKARAIIEQCGYRRRLPELEDAEAVLPA